jgi:hypothetical protein
MERSDAHSSCFKTKTTYAMKLKLRQLALVTMLGR